MNFNKGWTCPNCNKSFAPFVTECHYCNAPIITTTKTTIDPLLYKDYTTSEVEEDINALKDNTEKK